MTDLLKECSKCKVLLQIGNFHKDKSRNGGFRTICKKCCKDVSKMRRARNRLRAASLPIPLSKTCFRCKTLLPVADFCKCSSSLDGLFSNCRKCATLDVALKRLKDPNKFKEYHLKRKYGMNMNEYNDMVDKQGGVCGICSGPPNGMGGLQVDHSHKCCPGDKSCGKCIRGLLCFRCNILIGSALDSAEILENARAYLSKFTSAIVST